MLKCASFIVLLLIAFLPTGIGQLILQSNHEVKIILKYGKNESYSRITDTILVKPNEPKTVILFKPGWIITLMDGKSQYFSFRDKFDFILDDEPKTIHLNLPISESIIYNSLINDSISIFNQKLKPIQTKRDYSSMQQLETFTRKDMEGFGKWSDSINLTQIEMGFVAASQISINPFSLVSQYAFGLYCDYMSDEDVYLCEQQLNQAKNLSLLPQRQLEALNNRLQSRIGMKLPKGEINTIEGKTLNLGTANEKIRILYFTSSTCGPCKLLKPELEKFTKNTKYKNIEFISISSEINEKGMKAALEAAKKTKAPWQHIVANHKDETISKYNVGNYPCLFILNSEAIIVSRIWGFNENTIQDLKAETDRLLQ